MRFLAVSLAALALAAAAASAQPDPSAKKKAAPATANAKAKAAHPAAATAKPGTVKASASKSVVSKAGAPKSVASKGTAPKAAASKTGAKTAAKTGAKSHRTVVARRPPTQQQPSVDRYREIQQALADKGYFQGTADGAWNTGSIEALKRFQKDQNLDPDGKIGSLSLIALGLGPKRGEAAPQAVKSGAEALPLDPPSVAQPQP